MIAGVILYVVAALGSASLLIRPLISQASWPYRRIGFIVLAQVAVLIPVHVVAAMALAGLIDRVEFVYLLGGQLSLLAAAVLANRQWPKERTGASRSEPREKLPLYLKMSGLVLGGAYLIGAINALTSYLRHFDAARYHLLLPVNWLLDGSFSISAATNWQLAMPGNAEATMFVLLSSGVEQLQVVAQWGPLLCLALSVYGMAFGLTKSRRAALSSVAILLTVPIVYFQTFSGYVDLFAVSFMMAAIALGERSLRSGDDSTESGLTWIWLAGLACGLAVGSKHVYLPFGGLFAVTLVVLHARKSHLSRKVMSSAFGVLMCGIAIPAAFWYMRAWLSTGNPLFPLGLTVGDTVLLQGVQPDSINGVGWAIDRWVRSEAEWLVYPWIEYQKGGGLTKYSVDSGLGGAFATYVPLGLVFAACLAWRRGTDQRLWFWLSAWAVCGVAWWFPLHQTLRFGLVFFLLSVVLASPLLAALSQTKDHLFGGIFFCSIVLTSGILALEPVAGIASRVIFDKWSRADIYRYPKAIDDLPDGATVLSLSTIHNIAMAGRLLNHRVVAGFEAPRLLTRDFLEARSIDYVVGRARDKTPVSLPGVELIYDEPMYEPISRTSVRWLIWKVGPPPLQ